MSEKKTRFSPRLIFIVCYIAYASIYIARLNLTMASTTLMEGGVFTASEYGVLGAVFAIVYACGRLFNGSLSDRLPPYLMISLGLTLTAVANIAVGFFPPFFGILLLWALNSYGQTMLWSAILCIVSTVNPPEKSKRMVGYLATTIAAGNVLSILISAFLIERFGVAVAFIVPGLIALVMATTVLFTTHGVHPTLAPAGTHRSLFSLFRDRDFRVTTLTSLLHGIMKDNTSYWMPLFLLSAYGMNIKDSSWYVLLIPLLGLAGRLLFPPLFRLAGEKETRLSFVAFVLCAGLSVALCFYPFLPAVVAAVALAFIYTATSMINTSLLSIYPLYYTESGNVASVSGVMDFAAYMGYGIGALCFGYIVESFGYATMYAIFAVAAFLSVAVMALFRKKA